MNIFFSAEFWKSLPVILGFLLELKKLWEQELSERERRVRLREFKEALEKARQRRDISGLDSFINGDSNKLRDEAK